MKLDPDERKLLESFERGEWTSVEGDRIAVREYARQQLRVDVKAGFDAIACDTGCSRNPDSGRQLAKRIKIAGRARPRAAR